MTIQDPERHSARLCPQTHYWVFWPTHWIRRLTRYDKYGMPTPSRTIRFCVNNTSILREREQLIESGCEIRDCLGRCSECFDRRFVAVGDTVIEGDSYEEILKRARALDPTAEKQPAEKRAPENQVAATTARANSLR